jgi:hypothetical protein
VWNITPEVRQQVAEFKASKSAGAVAEA